jgi:hypothetical protein
MSSIDPNTFARRSITSRCCDPVQRGREWLSPRISRTRMSLNLLEICLKGYENYVIYKVASVSLLINMVSYNSRNTNCFLAVYIPFIWVTAEGPPILKRRFPV